MDNPSRRLAFFCAAALFVPAAVLAGAGKTPSLPGMEILVPGQFHGAETSAKSGEEWMALFPGQGGYRAAKTRLLVKPVHDLGVDKEGEASGKEVTSDELPQPLFFFRGLEVREGSIPTALPEGKALYAGEFLRFELGNHNHFVLYARGCAAGAGEIRDYELILRHGARSQTLARRNEVTIGEGSPSILWAGDLDGDGLADFFMDLTDYYNKAVYTLLLSSAAKPGEIAGQAGQFSTRGLSNDAPDFVHPHGGHGHRH
jgi:hypothetical protein